MHCTVLLSGTVLCCVVMHCTVLLSGTVLRCVVMHCTVLLSGTVLCCVVMHCTVLLSGTVLCCVVMHCTVLCCAYIHITKRRYRHQILRVVRHHTPRALLLENVPGLAKLQGGAALRVILSSLSALGYRVSHRLLNARLLVPQSRKRLYIVAIRSDLRAAAEAFRWPRLPDLSRRLEEVLEPEDALPAALTLTLTDRQWQSVVRSPGYKAHPHYHLARLDDVSATVISNYRNSTAFSQFVPHRERPVAVADLEADCDRDRDKDAAANTNTPSRSQTESRSCAGGRNPRWLLPRECARLQGFPEEFVFECGHRWSYRLVGNAVCPPVIAAIAGPLLGAIYDRYLASRSY